MLKVLEIRKRQEMSQGTPAKKVGIEQGSLCDIERGRRKPSFDVLIRLAIALECSLDELVDMDAYRTAS